ncbi:MAG: putative transporter [Hydrocarboniphaga sp.]|uniref:efflux RND transporter permease subunit n=1 Tax=Hydrocarboniphaga sp. TaxID=2033016 RepID=UPI0026254D0E|nr:MMPL family transporter [Hydrocarboniphaga sp.]MDB5968405.1 putative transporter [Hydrocarboniphaga sp.]
MAASLQTDAMPVVRDRASFDSKSGNVLERLIFNHRLAIVLLCTLVSALLGWQAIQLRVNASFEKMLPQSQAYIQNYLANKDFLRSLGNSIRIDVENTKGDIYDPDYLRVLQDINDLVFLMPGVDRSFQKSLWTPGVRWTQVTEEGFRGGPVMPQDYDGTAASLDTLRSNVGRAGLVGNLVANNQKSSTVFVPLLDLNPDTGAPLDYAEFARALEDKVRSKQNASIHIHIVGFAKLVGDLIDGLVQVMAYFAVAAVMAGIVIFLYTRCIRSTLLVVACSLMAVLWQLGIVHLLGYVLDPYSVLVPFLVFAIGVSHGAQKMNGIMQDVGRGTHRYVAARYTFRRLFLAGLTALIADAVSFAVLMIIDIPVIRDLAMTASLGVGVLIFTNLVLLPILLSYIGVSPKAAARAMRAESNMPGRFALPRLACFTQARYAVPTLIAAAILAVAGYVVSLNLKIGDLDPGAPELRADSRYNRDNSFIAANYGLSSDQFVIIVKTPTAGIATFNTLTEQDRLQQKLRELPSVQTVASASQVIRFATSGSYEGSPKWLSINRDQAVLSPGANFVSDNNPELINKEWSLGTVIAYLKDHKAETLEQIVEVSQQFADRHNNQDVQFLLAAGSSGIDAATNITVKQANRTMLLLVYAAVITLCFITFRSWRAVVVAVVPLALTSILCEALMVVLGIGVKVATLPVIALGVGIGVDYALYLLSVQLTLQRSGLPLGDAYARAVSFTGKVVALVGVTLAAGVITWAWSPIKFQADMGILLTFMFLWNMLGALVLIPALSSFLLRDVATMVHVGERAAHA